MKLGLSCNCPGGYPASVNTIDTNMLASIVEVRVCIAASWCVVAGLSKCLNRAVDMHCVLLGPASTNRKSCPSKRLDASDESGACQQLLQAMTVRVPGGLCSWRTLFKTGLAWMLWIHGGCWPCCGKAVQHHAPQISENSVCHGEIDPTIYEEWV